MKTLWLAILTVMVAKLDQYGGDPEARNAAASYLQVMNARLTCVISGGKDIEMSGILRGRGRTHMITL